MKTFDEKRREFLHGLNSLLARYDATLHVDGDFVLGANVNLSSNKIKIEMKDGVIFLPSGYNRIETR